MSKRTLQGKQVAKSSNVKTPEFCDICNKEIDGIARHVTLKTHLALETLKLSNPTEYYARQQRENNKIECKLCNVKLVPSSLNEHKRSAKHISIEDGIWKKMLNSCRSYNLRENNDRRLLGLMPTIKLKRQDLPLDVIQHILEFLPLESIGETFHIYQRFAVARTGPRVSEIHRR